MVMRLGELTGQPAKEVLSVYRNNRKKGWGVMAKKLGIKPGSREFHALKRGHDLGHGQLHDNELSSRKGKQHGHKQNHNGKGKNKH